MSSIRIVYAKELLDLLRDRRTIISMVVVPILLLPVIMVTMVSLTSKLMGQARQEISKVMILGGEDSPATVGLLRKLPSVQFVPASADFTNLISERRIRAAVEIPKGFDDAVRRGDQTTARIFIYEGDMKSMMAADALEQFFRRCKDSIVGQRLAAAHLPKSTLTPFEVERSNVASPEKVAGNVVGMILPYLAIVMCMTGSLYPAVDLTAGEKERGTMETLLTSPAPRTHLVLGKGLAVMTMSIVTATLALAANGVALIVMKKLVADPAKAAAFPVAINFSSLLAVGALLAPLAVFFAALMVAVGLYSRSTKEANSYLQPMLILAVLPAVAAALPGIELNMKLCLIPVLNVSLLGRELLSGVYHWNYMAVVFFSMCAYAGLAVAAAVAAFNRESVLFRT